MLKSNFSSIWIYVKTEVTSNDTAIVILLFTRPFRIQTIEIVYFASISSILIRQNVLWYVVVQKAVILCCRHRLKRYVHT